MSIRAYEIIKERKLKKEATFNVGEEFGWVESLAYYSSFSDGGECSYIEFDIRDLRNELKRSEDKHQKEIIKKIIIDCGDNDTISYECY